MWQHGMEVIINSQLKKALVINGRHFSLNISWLMDGLLFCYDGFFLNDPVELERLFACTRIS